MPVWDALRAAAVAALLSCCAPSAAAARCPNTTQVACTADAACGWQEPDGCYIVHPVVGYGECRDASGAVPARYISLNPLPANAGEGRTACQDLCAARPDCLGSRELADPTSDASPCVLYVTTRSERPPREFEFMDGTSGTAVLTASGDVSEPPTDAASWVCSARPCDEGDCGCVGGEEGCRSPAGVKGACVCSVTLTVSATLVPPYLDECGGMPCGRGQECEDAVPEAGSLGDYTCTCFVSRENRTGGAVPRCVHLDECGAESCGPQQRCSDPTPYPSATGDFWCACAAVPQVQRQGEPAVCEVDECLASPCGFAQTCQDPNVSIASISDFVCTCPAGEAWAVASTPAVCDYNECAAPTPCGDAQHCTDDNATTESLGDFICECNTTGATSRGASVANCTAETDAPPTEPLPREAPAEAGFLEANWWVLAAGGGALLLAVVIVVVCVRRKRQASTFTSSPASPSLSAVSMQPAQPPLASSKGGDVEMPFLFPPAFMAALVPPSAEPVVQYSQKQPNLASVCVTGSEPANVDMSGCFTSPSMSPLGAPRHTPPEWDEPKRAYDTCL